MLQGTMQSGNLGNALIMSVLMMVVLVVAVLLVYYLKNKRSGKNTEKKSLYGAMRDARNGNVGNNGPHRSRIYDPPTSNKGKK